jgi:alpha-methylacyl-CoA racemase
VGARSLPATHDGGQALADWGWSREDIARLAASGAMAA